jgi:Fe-S-cluster containining protein
MSSRPLRFHLPILGEPREIAVPAPDGPTPLGDLLPAARALSAQAMEIALAREESEGRAIRCSAGCGACCRQIVPISVVEARALARAVDALPPAERAATRARFAGTVKRMEQLGLLDAAAPPGRMTLKSAVADPRAAWADVTHRYWAAQMPCPLLVDERCSIYDERPIVCREFLVTSPPERCAKLGEATVVPRPIHGSEALATAIREYSGEPLPMLPLPLSLEWSEARGAMLDETGDGDNLVNHLVAAADELMSRER